VIAVAQVRASRRSSISYEPQSKLPGAMLSPDNVRVVGTGQVTLGRLSLGPWPETPSIVGLEAGQDRSEYAARSLGTVLKAGFTMRGYKTWFVIPCLVVVWALSCELVLPASAMAQQIDIQGPSGSGEFGTAVAVLPNGNIVVTDPNYNKTLQTGAVYLFSPQGNLISSFSGSSPNDFVGSGGITVLASGNFVVSSPGWNNGAAACAGAATWVNAVTGLSGTVSAANSLVGSTANDAIGASIVSLANGNYVVLGPTWSNNGVANAGAATWGNGNAGVFGPVSALNSLVGVTEGDSVGAYGVFELTNGNYVVASANWTNSAAGNAGAVTWADGGAGVFGAVSSANSLVGTKSLDRVGYGGVTPLTNGSYVVDSYHWGNGSVGDAGAVTWARGDVAASGAVSQANSLVGSATGALVGDGSGVYALRNGNYVVTSRFWTDGATMNLGAATWGNGSVGTLGVVSLANSLVGLQEGDYVGNGGIVALSNGNYAVISNNWANGAATQAGAVTWGSGTGGLVGVVSTANSLVGSQVNDSIGQFLALPLTNGNYVVVSPNWSNASTPEVGAVTWVNGNASTSAVVSEANSLVGTTADDRVGNSGVTSLSNGNYVVSSLFWTNGSVANAGAVTWVDGAFGLSGPVSTNNSLVGTVNGDFIGIGITALGNGNYVIASSSWHNGAAAEAGAVTWADGHKALSGVISASNSLVGTQTFDGVGDPYVSAFSNNSYVIESFYWANGSISYAGAISVGRGGGGLVGPVLATNSVLASVARAGASLESAYDPVRDQLVVGQPAANVVSLFKADLLFTNGFE
jgi:Repeat of unknown function (DUF5650)